jgi:hypothetical protein
MSLQDELREREEEALINARYIHALEQIILRANNGDLDSLPKIY